MNERFTTVSAVCSFANAASNPAGAVYTGAADDAGALFFSAASFARKSWSNRLTLGPAGAALGAGAGVGATGVEAGMWNGTG